MTTRVEVRLRRDHRPLVVGAVAAAVAVTAAVVAVGTGDYALSPWEVLRTLAGGGSPGQEFVVFRLRLPRVVTGLLVGAALGISGAVLQSITRNALGSPDILGFTQGAAAGALFMIVLVGAGAAAVAVGAVTAALLTGAAIYLLAWRQGVHGFRLVLVGIAAAAILTGINGYLITRAQIFDAARAMLWLTGNLDGRQWHHAVPLLITLLVAVPLLLVGARGLRTLELGDDTALALGVRVEQLRLVTLTGAVALCAVAAAAAGPVTFVALAAPHLARRLTHAPGPNLLPSLWVGAALLICADLAAQRMVPGRDLPVGVATGVLGGGYLIWLLINQRRTGRL